MKQLGIFFFTIFPCPLNKNILEFTLKSWHAENHILPLIIINIWFIPLNCLRVIFGLDEPKINATARFIAEQLNSNKPLLISICLKSFEPSCLRTVVETIKKIAPQIFETS